MHGIMHSSHDYKNIQPKDLSAVSSRLWFVHEVVLSET